MKFLGNAMIVLKGNSIACSSVVVVVQIRSICGFQRACPFPQLRTAIVDPCENLVEEVLSEMNRLS